MKKPDIIKLVSDVSGKKLGDTNVIIKSLVKVIQRSVKRGETISLWGLGSFKLKVCKPRNGRNLKTGEKIYVPASNKVSFKPTVSFKKIIQGDDYDRY